MLGWEHKGEKGRGQSARMSLPSLKRTPQLGSCMMVTVHRVHLLLCPSKIFRHGNKNTLFLVMIYSAIFYNVFKALNLFLINLYHKFSCIAMAFWLLSFPQRFYTEFLPLVINITKCKEKRQL